MLATIAGCLRPDVGQISVPASRTFPFAILTSSRFSVCTCFASSGRESSFSYQGGDFPVGIAFELDGRLDGISNPSFRAGNKPAVALGIQ
jgi:hypothetical protein